MYRARSELDENDSVSPAITQRMTNAHQYQVVNNRLMKARFKGARSALVTGNLEMAKARSDSLRYGARVVDGVSGKRKRP
jgi:hypothetical protein